MARNFTNENFERFLQQNADGMRMRPSDRVWKGIAQQLNKRKRRFGFGLVLALLMTSTGGYFLFGDHKQPAIDTGINSDNRTENSAPSSVSIKREAPVRSIFSNRNPEVVRSSVEGTSRELLQKSQTGLTAHENIAEQQQLVVGENIFVPTVRDESHLDEEFQTEEKTISHRTAVTDPLTIESVINSFKPARKKRASMQYYFTPTVSYRKLRENKAYISNVPPVNVPVPQQGFYDINSAVTHKPAFGFEVGAAVKYPLAKNISLRGGLQFNVARYDIKVFNSSTQLATIMLRDNHANAATTSTIYNNFTGYESNWLENFYFQISAPVGIEAVIKGDEKVKFGVATTVQPTYVLGERAYLISTDYKNYAEFPDLTRRWNLNTSVETFVSYSTGQLKWQVGPQVRYQLLSSFVKEYPVKENLFDFGLKVGVGLNK